MTDAIYEEMLLKHVSIDLETLGLDADENDFIEFGAVIDDLETPLAELPRYHCYLPKDLYRGQAYAMSMHPTILRRIAIREEGWAYIPHDCLGENFASWLVSNGYEKDKQGKVSISVSGKNFAMFDNNFLKNCPGFTDHIKIAHRVLDPGILYADPRIDKKLPDFKQCLERAGLSKEVEHTAIEDALDVCYLLRKKWNIPV